MIPTQPTQWLSPSTIVPLSLLVIGLFCLVACGSPDAPQPQSPAQVQVQPQARACGDRARTLNVGFYAYFAPVSYSESDDSSSAQFNVHQGYEADLLTAVETMEEPKLSFSRQGIARWDDIWLQSATGQYDIVGGGITILDSRTRDATGNEVVTFTSGHIKFRQSLLVRAEDTERLAGYADLTGDVRVGVLSGTTGEHRFLEIMGLVDAAGALADGVRVDTPQGTVVADGSKNYSITAAEASPILAGRTHLYPPSGAQPQVVYLGSETGDAEPLEALSSGKIDAIARGEIGSRDAASVSGGVFVVAALNDQVETGGFTVAAEDTELAACLNERLNRLTDNQRIAYKEWLEDPAVFMRRAQQWNDGAWNDGAWNDGAWNDGAWNDGAWNDGTWNDGTW